MEKLYTQKEYQLQAEQANKYGLFLYQFVKEQEYTIEVLEYEKKIVSQDIYSEDGEIIGSQEVEIDDLNKPVMIEEEITNPETGKKEAVIVQKHHTETRTKTVVELVIEPEGYYVCFKDNYTNGEINPYYKDEKVQKERERLNKLSVTRGDMFEAIILAFGKTKADIRSMIENVEGLTDIERALYLNRFDEALDFYRGYPAVDLIGQMLGISSEQLDKFFEFKDYKYLIPNEPVTEEVTEETDVIPEEKSIETDIIPAEVTEETDVISEEKSIE